MQRIRDALHGFVSVRPVEAALIESAPVQRLRRVRQLGLTSYVYPGAEHTRFTHAIGAMHVAGQLAETLVREGWTGSVDLVRVGALLHDVGHPPLSHAGERGVRHEHMSLALIRSGEIAAILAAHGIEPEAVAGLVEGTGESVGASLVAGEIDADRMDYLLRDSRMCGVRYGEYDLARLVETVTVADGRVAVKRAGLHAAEGLLLARYSMFLQVYFHRTRRILDLLLEEALPPFPIDPAEWLEWDDHRVMEWLRQAPGADAQAVWRRQLPACVVELEVTGAAGRRADAAALADVLAGVAPRVWVDSTARMRTFRPEGDMALVEEDGAVTSVFAASPVLRRMDPDVEVRRIYVPRPYATPAREAVTRFRNQGLQLRLFG